MNVPTNLVVLDKSALISSPTEGDKWIPGRSLGIPMTLLTEIFTGNPELAQRALKKLRAVVGRAEFLYPLKELIKKEVTGRRRVESLVSSSLTESFRKDGLRDLSGHECNTARADQEEGTVHLWRDLRPFFEHFDARRELGGITLDELRDEANLPSRYEFVLNSKIPKKLWEVFAGQIGWNIPYEELESDWVTRHLVDALSLVLYDEYLAQRFKIMEAPPRKFHNDRLDAEYLALSAAVGALATEDKIMKARAVVLNPTIEITSSR